MTWQLAGNSGTNPATDFLGTTDGQPLAIRTSGAERLRITADGNLGIGTAQPGAKLEIRDGDLLLKAAANAPGDIVFQGVSGEQRGRIWSQPAAGGAGLYFASGTSAPALSIDAI